MRLILPRFFPRRSNGMFFMLAACLLVTLPVAASEPSSRTLDSGWQFRAVGKTDNPDIQQWHPAQVPGVVHTDLLQNNLIPDPFDRDNEFRLQWIGLTDWEYQTTFQVDSVTTTSIWCSMAWTRLPTST